MHHPLPGARAVTCIALTLAANLALGQDPEPAAEAPSIAVVEGDTITLRFDEESGTPVKDFIRVAEDVTGLQFTFEAAELKDMRLHFLGEQTMPRSEFWAYFHAVLRSKDLVVVSYGEPAAPGRPSLGSGIGYFAIRRAQGSSSGNRPGYIKTQATVVTADQLDAFRGDAGLVLTTSFQLEHANAQEVVNMLNTYFTDPMIESVRAVGSSNALVATGYAPTLHAMKQLLSLVDVAPKEVERHAERLQLQHVVAQEIEPILEAFVASEQPRAVNPAMPPMPVPSQAPVVVADPDGSALLVLATDADLRRIRGYVQALDVAGRGASVASTVIHVQHAVAAEIADTLKAWNSDPRVRLEADERTNSVIVSAPQDRMAEVQAIIAALDVAVEASKDT